VLPSFGVNCAPCHNTTVWRPSTFNHSNTRYPLTGAHQATACNQCHVNNVYRDLPQDCNSCHAGDFNGTTNPNHAARNFSRNCTQCHTTTAWVPASFDHNASRFPLTGRHTTATCVSCHVGGNYNLVYNDCYQCHQADFARPTNPNHVTLQFSHDCTPCHTTTAWRPTTYNHDVQYFRIYSGKHRNKWTQCSECHPTPGNYGVFTCISCHEHRQSAMDNEHRGVTGYSYNSQRCYDCHRNV
jgi:nitrate/TMAO reductase-like tetraheme cytochrome c subunit